MYDVITQMAALIACGVIWRIIQPYGLDADHCRKVITQLVYTLLLPALVLHVLWLSPLGADSARLSLSAMGGILLALALACLAYRIGKTDSRIAGALVLAATFPNATYMGLPVLEQLLGPWAKTIAIQYDLFACTPLLLTVGIIVARTYGEDRNSQGNLVVDLLKVPPLWAALLAVVLNVSGTPMPEWIDGWLQLLSTPVVPLMLIAVGMSLTWSAWQPQYLPLMLPVIAIQLIITPLLVFEVAQLAGLEGDYLVGTVIEAAMPAMVIGLVFCDRYNLHAGLYAIAVTLTTALSLFTIPFWFNYLQGIVTS